MRTREELDELWKQDSTTYSKGGQWDEQMRELALDQRDLLAEIRDLLKEQPRLLPGDAVMPSFLPYRD